MVQKGDSATSVFPNKLEAEQALKQFAYSIAGTPAVRIRPKRSWHRILKATATADHKAQAQRKTRDSWMKIARCEPERRLEQR